MSIVVTVRLLSTSNSARYALRAPLVSISALQRSPVQALADKAAKAAVLKAKAVRPERAELLTD
jgi:hypothetical protein